MPDGQRGEVISVVQRRRRWTTEQKLALVEEAMQDRKGMDHASA